MLKDVNEFIGEKVLIVGEVNSGKTNLTTQILCSFIEKGEREIAILDLAPSRKKGVGGKIKRNELPINIPYYTTRIETPRLSGKNSGEVIQLAKINVKRIERLFAKYKRNPRKVLFINDVSLYLQQGDLNKLLKIYKLSETVIANGYYGYSLGDDEFSAQERKAMERLMEESDLVIRL